VAAAGLVLERPGTPSGSVCCSDGACGGYPTPRTRAPAESSRSSCSEGGVHPRPCALEESRGDEPSSPSTPMSGSKSALSTPLASAARSPSGPLEGGVRLPAIATRASSTGAIGRSGVTRSHLTVRVTSKFDDAEVSVELAEGELDRGCDGLPATLAKDQSAVVQLRSSGAIVGNLRVAGMAPIPFGIQVKPSTSGPGGKPAGGVLSTSAAERMNFVAAEHRQKSVVAQAVGELDASSGLGAKGDGTVVEASVGPGWRAEMTVLVRRAKKKELARLAQEQALLHAMEQKRYSSLLAQISRAKMRKVETSLIDQAGRLLKTIKMPESSFLSHKELGKLMKWKRVTCPSDATGDDVHPCGASSECHCNAGEAQPGEVCDVLNGMVERALDGVAPAGVPADKWLFKALVHAAMHAPEGCVWKSGGKFLLTNEERNQAPNAIVSILERDNAESDAGKGIRALVAHTENVYNFQVTAIQLNFHPNNKSSHKQHRDIYGAGQKGGINCTCSFKKCTGTVCYSLGSSRQVLTETICDTRSKYEACGEECQGCKTYRWMHSGSAMYFNAPWNNNNTHGVPQLEEACGPRISVALLCA